MVDPRAAVVLTRAVSDNQALRLLLEAADHRVLELPTAAFEGVSCDPTLRPDARAITFTSPHGWQAWQVQAGAEPLILAQKHGLLVGAVGPATAQALADAGITADVVAAAPATGRHLAELLASQLTQGALVTVVQAAHSQPDLAETLQSAGLCVDLRTVYRNIEPPAPAAELLAKAAHARAIYVAAPSAVDRVLAWAPQLRDRPFVAIGPTTGAVLRDRHRIEPARVCPAPDLASVSHTLLSFLS